ncbi:unnamed protein product [Camellia sinensis]
MDSPHSLITAVLSLLLFTSCINTSNPSVMLGAGLVAKKACELGLQFKSWIKTSLAPGSGVVTKYLLQSGLQKYLNEQGFHIVGYGCTTCIGNLGDLDESVASAISKNDITLLQLLYSDPGFYPLLNSDLDMVPRMLVCYRLAVFGNKRLLPRILVLCSSEKFVARASFLF